MPASAVSLRFCLCCGRHQGCNVVAPLAPASPHRRRRRSRRCLQTCPTRAQHRSSSCSRTPVPAFERPGTQGGWGRSTDMTWRRWAARCRRPPATICFRAVWCASCHALLQPASKLFGSRTLNATDRIAMARRLTRRAPPACVQREAQRIERAAAAHMGAQTRSRRGSTDRLRGSSVDRAASRTLPDVVVSEEPAAPLLGDEGGEDEELCAHTCVRLRCRAPLLAPPGHRCWQAAPA